MMFTHTVLCRSNEHAFKEVVIIRHERIGEYALDLCDHKSY